MTTTRTSEIYHDPYDVERGMGVALDEVLQRFLEWEVDWSRAKLAPTSTVRGWETLPVHTP